MVFGVKNMFEVEGELSCRESQFRFLNRAVPLFCLENFSLKPGCKRYVKMSVPFIDKTEWNCHSENIPGKSVLHNATENHEQLCSNGHGKQFQAYYVL